MIYVSANRVLQASETEAPEDGPIDFLKDGGWHFRM